MPLVIRGAGYQGPRYRAFARWGGTRIALLTYPLEVTSACVHRLEANATLPLTLTIINRN